MKTVNCSGVASCQNNATGEIIAVKAEQLQWERKARQDQADGSAVHEATFRLQDGSGHETGRITWRLFEGKAGELAHAGHAAEGVTVLENFSLTLQ